MTLIFIGLAVVAVGTVVMFVALSFAIAAVEWVMDRFTGER